MNIKSLQYRLIVFLCATSTILTTEGNLGSEINRNATLATEMGVVSKGIAQAWAPAPACIVPAQLIVEARADVDVAGSKELLVENVTVCCVCN